VSAHRTVVVGAGVGGLSAAERMRELGHTGAITLLGDEAHAPYHRPPLSKQVLSGEWDPGRTDAATPGRLAELDVAFRPGARATGLDPDRRILRVGAYEVPYDELVIATGVRARTVPGIRPLAGVHACRTRDDAVALRADAVAGRRALVVGAGILGSEIAAGLVKRGLRVVLVGRGPRLAFGRTGTLLSDRIADAHRAHGVDVRLSTGVVGLSGADRVTGAVLSDGTRVPADLVVVAAGSIPNTEWIGAALAVSDGVVCDASGRAAPHVHAIGDVARWADAAGSARVEHQQNAIEQARAVADAIVLGRPASAPTPFFWSELYGSRVQAYGRFDGRPLEIVAGSVEDGRFVAADVRDGRVHGAVGWNLPRAFRDARLRIDADALPSADRPERQLVP
jgi:3-phenylpropionate/trans-cinnamate dioxygenase ferredoxin reductase component